MIWGFMKKLKLGEVEIMCRFWAELARVHDMMGLVTNVGDMMGLGISTTRSPASVISSQRSQLSRLFIRAVSVVLSFKIRNIDGRIDDVSNI